MRKKKFYIPIGALIIALCAIGLFALQPKEPMIYKTERGVYIIEQPKAETPVAKSQGGHSHDSGKPHYEVSKSGVSDVEYNLKSENSENNASLIFSDEQLKAVAKSEEVYKRGLADRQVVLRYEQELAEHNQKVSQHFEKMREMDKELEQLIPLERVDTLIAYIESLGKDESEQLLLKLKDFQRRYDELFREADNIFNSEPEYPQDAYNRLKDIALRNTK